MDEFLAVVSAFMLLILAIGVICLFAVACDLRDIVEDLKKLVSPPAEKKSDK